MEEWSHERLQATVRTAALCAYVDGHLAPEEREKLCECIGMHAGSEREARLLIAAARELPEYVGFPKSGTRAAELAEIKRILRTRPEREYAFFLAVQVARAHQGILAEETVFLLNLVTELDIDGDYARRLVRRARERS